MYSQDKSGEEDDEDEGPPPTFEKMFEIFSKLGDPESDGTAICLTASNKWMKLAKVLDGKTLTETDTGITFYKFKKRSITLDQYHVFLKNLAIKVSMDVEGLYEKLTTCDNPNKPRMVGTVLRIKLRHRRLLESLRLKWPDPVQAVGPTTSSLPSLPSPRARPK